MKVDSRQDPYVIEETRKLDNLLQRTRELAAKHKGKFKSVLPDEVKCECSKNKKNGQNKE